MGHSFSTLLVFISAFILLFPSAQVLAQEKTARILMVLSSYGEKNTDGELVKPGYEFDEMSKAYLVFKHAGADVDFTSPKGGELVTDNYDKNKRYNQSFLADEAAVHALASSLKLSDINADNYDAVFVVGGKGPMFDLRDNKQLKRVIRDIYERGGAVGAVCHGPAALLDIKLSDGSYLVGGKRISAFSNEEEAVFSKKWQLPFLLEDELSAQGAVFRQDALMLNQVSVDQRLVTGQNPFSTADTAKALVEQLGLEFDAGLEFKDDKTVKLVEAFFKDRKQAAKQYQQTPESYDTMLLAMLGVYHARYAKSEIERDVAIVLMQQTIDEIKHAALYTALVEAYIDENELAQAAQLLKQSKALFPDDQGLATLRTQLANR
ncbi:DJ-1/PfpI family protein [Agaribacterium haliotis]|uniref:DJ-1/PfpI family protein n=1 Tax=Agaribacterium haliotis TaxID=2013869 RepID=UPI000BB563C0|nr:DJ-1/PfpI family protein [Agaribacterium haliotis]